MHIIWIIIIGFIAGVVAKLVTPGDNEPKGFIITTILGIVGAFVATYLGQAIGWYGEGQGAGLVRPGRFVATIDEATDAARSVIANLPAVAWTESRSVEDPPCRAAS
jgi:uncharacterized membrane protein YeaQ/YmgE (transglycosylase-associated protein family)